MVGRWSKQEKRPWKRLCYPGYKKEQATVGSFASTQVRHTEPEFLGKKSAAEAPHRNGNRRQWHRNQSDACPAHHCIFSLIHCCLWKDSPSPQSSSLSPHPRRRMIHVQPGYSWTPDKQHEHSQRQNPATALACTHTFIMWCSACPRDQPDPGKMQKQGPKPSWPHRTRAELLLKQRGLDHRCKNLYYCLNL